MATEIKQLILRRGTGAQWESANPVLAEGEIGLNRDNGRFKVGDGTARWNELAYPDEGMSWRGPWDAGTVYEPRDAVAHEGASYVADVQTVAGDEPGVSAKWDLLAKAGTVNGGTLSADLDADGFRVLGLPTPSVAGEAAPKGYVDGAIDSATSEPGWLGAESLHGGPFPGYGTPTKSNNSRWPYWLLDASTQERLGGNLIIPSGWTTVNVDLYWTNPSTDTGDAQWIGFIGAYGDGDSTAKGLTTITAGLTATAPAQDTLKVTRLGSGIAITAGSMNNLLLTREATNAADTLANDAAVLGVLISKAS